jgi:uncharacterized protein
LTPRPFLRARWSNLVFLTFEAAEDAVRAHIPPGVEPDRWEGKTHVSLVALQMVEVRVLDWRLPGFGMYPQVNFRTYLRCAGHPAVSFVRELVPSRLVAAVARLRYGEPFQTARIEAHIAEHADGIRAEYRFGPHAPRYRIAVTGSHAAAVPLETSFEHHLIERTHGCGSDRGGRLRTFRVEHPRWAVRAVSKVDYEVDFEALYGAEWRWLNTRTPRSVIFAVGSDVAVHPPATR